MLRQERPQQWVIHTDFLAALEGLIVLTNNCVIYAKQLQTGVAHSTEVWSSHSFALRWKPGHGEISGNSEVDDAGKAGHQMSQRSSPSLNERDVSELTKTKGYIVLYLLTRYSLLATLF